MMKTRKPASNMQYERAATLKTPKPPPTEAEISRRAHEIFLARGGTPGKELDDWLRAEQELKQQHAGAETPTNTPPPE
jgi:hypothetical protein